jgi:hypothetical protein
VADLLAHLLGRLGRCDELTVATLGFSRRNLKALLGWLDGGQVGELTLLASRFFAAHNGALADDARVELTGRGQRFACAASHAKVACMSFAGGGRLALEGSANLVGNGSGREQFVLCHDAELVAFHTRWIVDLVQVTARDEEAPDQAEGDGA